jgi:putative transposase
VVRVIRVLCESVAPRWGEEDSTVTKRRRHTPDQIIRKLAEGHKLLAGGTELDEVCRHLQIAESTWHRWVSQYGGMKASDAKRLKLMRRKNVLVALLPDSG